DIDEHNIMNNLYCLRRYSPTFATTLADYRRTSRVLFCLYDFNLSLQFPLDTPLCECRVPVDLSCMSGTPYRPLDASLGAYDYDPLAYDVSCLGNMFRMQFALIHFSLSHPQTVVGSVPELAPLFDKMTTHIVCDRYSTSEALAHFEEVASRLPDHTLQEQVVLEMNWELEDTERYWLLLSPESAATWADYRTPRLSLGEKVLWYIFRYRFGRTVLRYVRRVLQV
ncbi:hypothetical protein C8T65DRAFT_585288, partial [Cerioporus squamosus]